MFGGVLDSQPDSKNEDTISSVCLQTGNRSGGGFPWKDMPVLGYVLCVRLHPPPPPPNVATLNCNFHISAFL